MKKDVYMKKDVDVKREAYVKKEKFVIRRLMLKDGTLPRPEDIIGYYTPVAFLTLRRGERYRHSNSFLPETEPNRFYILIFVDYSDPHPEFLFAQVERRAFMRCIRERDRMDWLDKIDGGKRKMVQYTGYQNSIPDDQRTAKFEFTYF